MGSYKDLIVYKKSFQLAMEVFFITKNFPKDEIYGLTSQLRRSSRGVCSNIVEGYRKRQYPAHFSSKMSDADMENSETNLWIEFAFQCEYITQETKDDFEIKISEIGKILNFMILNPEKFSIKGLNKESKKEKL